MTLALRNAAILSPDASGYRDENVIVIDDTGRIADLARKAPDGVPTVDVRGATALPGLIDMHAHTVFGTAAEGGTRGQELTVGQQTIRGVTSLERAARHGITTIRDAGSPTHAIFALKAATENRTITGPRMIVAGNALSITGGHCWNTLCLEADGVAGVRRAARLQLKAGAACIKLMASAGAGTPGQKMTASQFGRDEMAAAVTEARLQGAHTLAHATTATSVREAVAAGVDSVEHGIFLDSDAVSDMKSAGVYFCPTLSVYHRIAENRAPGKYPDFMIDKAKQSLSSHHSSFQLAAASGIPIIAGSDAGNHGWHLGDLADEICQLAEYGLPVSRCIQAATSTAAELLALSDEIGTLEVGKHADILLVNGDPVTDLQSIRSVHSVYVRGHKVAR